MSAKSKKPIRRLTLFRIGLFEAAVRWKGRHPRDIQLPKTCHTCSTMMKLGTVISYLKKIQKVY